MLWHDHLSARRPCYGSASLGVGQISSSVVRKIINLYKKIMFFITLSVVYINLSFREYDMLLISKTNLSLQLANYNAQRTLVYNIFFILHLSKEKKKIMTSQSIEKLGDKDMDKNRK
jgi:hypothetical protein